VSADSDQRLEIQYSAGIQNLVFEGQAFWTRITAFVLLNSALLVARSALPTGAQDRWIRFSIALLGAVSTLLWAHSGLRSHYLRRYWLASLRDLERRMGIGSSGPFSAEMQFLEERQVTLSSGESLRFPLLAQGTVDDSSALVLTVVFLAIWLVALLRLS
jgi:hypothetical protein